MISFPKSVENKIQKAINIQKKKYYKMYLISVLIAIAHMMLAATTMAVVIFGLHIANKHAIISMLGHHFFPAQAILAIIHLGGWTAKLRFIDRKLIHMILQVSGFIFAVIGVFMHDNFTSITFHGCTGYAALLFSFVSIIIGPIAYLFNEKWSLVHMIIGIVTFTLSSISLLAIFFREIFKIWSGNSVLFLLVCFVFYYTIVIILNCILRVIAKYKVLKENENS